jgi:hypothetical protein
MFSFIVKLTGIAFDVRDQKTVVPVVVGKQVSEENGKVRLSEETKIAELAYNSAMAKKFEVSSQKYDAGQYVEPFFVKQDVVLSYPNPLTGLNFYYYETEEKFHNKFISAQLRGVDMNPESLIG